MAGETEFLTYKETAALLGISYQTVVRWVRPGPHGEPPILQAFKIGPATIRIRRSDVLALLDPSKRPGREPEAASTK